MDTFGTNAMAVLRASIVGAFAAGVLFAVWFVIGMVSVRHVSARDVFDIAAGAAIWVFLCTVVGPAITLPATALSALAGAAIVRLTGWSYWLPFQIGGFLVGTFVWWFAFNRGAPDKVMMFSNWLSAPFVGGIAGFIAGRVLARRWV